MLLKRALEAINRRAHEALEKRLRLAVRSTNADLVRECLNEIRDDADRNLGTPVPWRECLPAAILDALLLVTYLADWARADAADEANVHAAFAADV